MKPFKFSLQALLVLREQEEQESMQKYGKTLVVRERATSALRAAEEELTNAYFHLGEKLGTNCSSVELVRLQNYCQSVEWRVRECEQTAELAREQTQEAFMELLAARQARSVLDKFMAREKSRYLREKRRREQKALEDIPSRRETLAAFLDAEEISVWN